MISTVSEGLSLRLNQVLNRDVKVSYNGFMKPQWKIDSTGPWNDNKVHIVYTGRLYPQKRDPKTFLHALARFRDSARDFHHHIAVDFYGFDVPYVRFLTKKYDLGNCVKAHGFVSYEESLAIQRSAGVLLFLDWADENVEGILTGKLFEYLVSGRPILCVGTRKNTEAAEIVQKCKCGVTLTSDQEIQAYLRGLLVRVPTTNHDHDQINSYSREYQAKILLEHIAKSIR